MLHCNMMLTVIILTCLVTLTDAAPVDSGGGGARGEITRIDAGQLRFEMHTWDLGLRHVQLHSGSRILDRGQAITIEQLRPGDQVVVHFELRSKLARLVQVIQPARQEGGSR